MADLLREQLRVPDCNFRFPIQLRVGASVCTAGGGVSMVIAERAMRTGVLDESTPTTPLKHIFGRSRLVLPTRSMLVRYEASSGVLPRGCLAVPPYANMRSSAPLPWAASSADC